MIIMDIRSNQVTVIFLVCQCFHQYVTENCLRIFTDNLTFEKSNFTCQEYDGRHLNLTDVLTNRKFVNQSRDFVSETRQSVWIDDKNGACRAFSWNDGSVILSKFFACSEKFHPACIFNANNSFCSEEPVDDIKSSDSFKTILIASLCGGAAVLISITLFVCFCCVRAKKPRRKDESHKVSSFELKRYRVSEGFNVPVITDDEIKGSVATEETELPYHILEKIGDSESNFNLKRTNDWVKEQASSLNEIDNRGICHHLAPSGPSEGGSDSFYRTDIIVAGNLSINNNIDS